MKRRPPEIRAKVLYLTPAAEIEARRVSEFLEAGARSGRPLTRAELELGRSYAAAFALSVLIDNPEVFPFRANLAAALSAARPGLTVSRGRSTVAP